MNCENKGKTVLCNGSDGVQNVFCCSVVRPGWGSKSSLSERGRDTKNILHISVQNEGLGCPKCLGPISPIGRCGRRVSPATAGCPECVQNVFCCRAVRLGRGSKSSLSERGRYTKNILHISVQNEGLGCPKCLTHKPHKTHRPHKSVVRDGC